MKIFFNLILILCTINVFANDINLSNLKTILNDTIDLEINFNDEKLDSIYYPEFITKEYNFLSQDIITQSTSNLDKLYKISKSNIKDKQ